MSKHKNPLPPAVRGKSGAKSRKPADQVEFASTVLASAPKAALAPAVAGPLTALGIARDQVVADLAAKAAADAAAKAANLALILSLGGLKEATSSLILAGEQACKGDASLLAALGVPIALPHSPPDPAPGGDVTKLTTKPGVSAGELDARAYGPAGSGGFIFEYKLEPSLPTDPWLPAGGAVTRYATHTFTGLGVQQLARVRACAIGASPGPWSLEVVGRAK